VGSGQIFGVMLEVKIRQGAEMGVGDAAVRVGSWGGDGGGCVWGKRGKGGLECGRNKRRNGMLCRSKLSDHKEKNVQVTPLLKKGDSGKKPVALSEF